jgi:predicted nucleotidyltransferase
MQDTMYEELVRGLLDILPTQTVRIVLYGSTARGTAGPESDVDIALFLNSRMDVAQEDRLSDLIADLDLKYDRVFSIVDIHQETYTKWLEVTPFYQNVEKEGIILWKAA